MMKTFEALFGTRPPSLLVVGDVRCDVYLWGEAARISPEAPTPVFEMLRRQQILGGAANVAANLRALGCQVYLLAVVSLEELGSALQDHPIASARKLVSADESAVVRQHDCQPSAR